MPLTTIRVSRRPRRCQRDCGVPIRAGQKAKHTAIPPGGDDLDQWIHLVSHAGPCPDPETMPPEELDEARAEHAAWFDRRLAELTDHVAALAARTTAL